MSVSILNELENSNPLGWHFIPSFGNPAVRNWLLTRGFAPLPHDRFAIIGKEFSLLSQSEQTTICGIVGLHGLKLSGEESRDNAQDIISLDIIR